MSTAITPYSPSNSHLALIPNIDVQGLCNSFSPPFYKLKPTDVAAIICPDGTVAYHISTAVAQSLYNFGTNIANAIIDAAAPLPANYHPLTHQVLLPRTITTNQLAAINMPLPRVLNFNNYFPSVEEVLHAHKTLQNLTIEGLFWVLVAKYQTHHLGATSLWKWGPNVDLPHFRNEHIRSLFNAYFHRGSDIAIGTPRSIKSYCHYLHLKDSLISLVEDHSINEGSLYSDRF
ncbi:hypothetical protein BDQ12DRAFT_669829 [Crucibulum laeve]|uniref:Uncharacterized protein n=1 Tax=Crucibulum laeve TaxID=68775 RepID=A0A5C3LL95_9AGAR|nr:hypothetical protein BDQ12DRAFT_669829 [Crucibulum laeve]